MLCLVVTCAPSEPGSVNLIEPGSGPVTVLKLSAALSLLFLTVGVMTVRDVLLCFGDSVRHFVHRAAPDG